MCRIAIPLDQVMPEDLATIMRENFSKDQKILETDDDWDVLILSDCSLDTIMKLLNLCTYLMLRKNYDDFVHTGVEIDVDLTTILDFDSELLL